MASGIAKWFNATKGFGFITPDEGGKDVFIHQTVVASAGVGDLLEGQRVDFDAEPAAKGPQATAVRTV